MKFLCKQGDGGGCFVPSWHRKKNQLLFKNDCRDWSPVLLFQTLLFLINSLTITLLFSWVCYQMSHRPSVDFDGSISPPPAGIPGAFICLSLTTVCLTDRLAAHSHSEAPAQPCSSYTKRRRRRRRKCAHTTLIDSSGSGGVKSERCYLSVLHTATQYSLQIML